MPMILTPTDGAWEDGFGRSVSLSADGLTAIVGGPGDDVGSNYSQGSARVFVWNGTAWVQRGAALTPTDGAASDYFGTSVSLSADGLTAIVGGQGDTVGANSYQGSARVFLWNGTAWVQRGAALTPADGTAYDYFGTSVSLSADGLTAIVGGQGDSFAPKYGQGSARVFVWNGMAWVQRGAPLTPTDGAEGDSFGLSVSLSADGLTAIVGGPGDDVGSNYSQGSTRVFVWNGTAWVQRGAALTPTDGAASDYFGTSVSLSADGLTAIVGGQGDSFAPNYSQGSARVFVWNGTAWVQRGAALTPTDGAAGDNFGQSVSLSPDGLIAIVGGPGDDVGTNDSQGSARVFVWNGSVWMEDFHATPSKMSVAATSAFKLEGNSSSTAYTFTVTRSGDTNRYSTATWAVTGSGSNPAAAADFEGGMLPSGTVTFAEGETSQIITVLVIGDLTGEVDEGFTVTLNEATVGTEIGTASASGTIQNDDTSLAIAPTSADKAEGHTGSTGYIFTVTRSGITNQVSDASWMVTGSGSNAASATDFVGGVLPSGTVSFAAGETNKTITVLVAGDSSVELDEGFAVTLSGASTGTFIDVASADGTIRTDDASLAIARQRSVRAEGQSGTTPFTFVITRSGVTTGATTAAWVVTGGGVSGTVAANGADFTSGLLPTGVVIFAAHETSKEVTLNVAGDGVVELNDSFTVTLATPLPGVSLAIPAATGIIFNDDTLGTGTLSIARASAQKAEGHSGSTPYTFAVTRSGDTAGTASADWVVTGGGGVGGTLAANAADFVGSVLPSGRVNFDVGQTSQTVTINVAGDSAIELNDSFTVTLGGLQAGVSLATPSATGVILNDDFPPSGVLSIGGLNASRSEGQGGTTDFTFVVTRSGDSIGPASATWAVTGGGFYIKGQPSLPANAADFAGGVLPSGIVNFAPGETSRIITVAVAGDAVEESYYPLRMYEDFTVTLANPAVGVTIATTKAYGFIQDDDRPGTGTLSIARGSAWKPEGHSGTTPLTFVVTRSGDTSSFVSADWSVAGGGVGGTVAANGSDFIGGALPHGRVNFGVGWSSQTITIAVAGDSAVELNESFSVTLSGVQAGVSLGTGSATGVILNDDFAPSGTLSIAPMQASRAEGQSGSTAFTFLVTRSGTTTGPASAKWAVMGGGVGGTVGASAADFIGGVLPSGTVSFLPGQTSQEVTVQVAGDTALEGGLNESFSVSLSDTPAGATIGTAAATGVIWNDDSPGNGTLSIARASAWKSEGNSGTTPFTFTVTRSGTTSGTASADWAVTGGGVGGTLAANGADFAGGILPNGRVSLAAGQTSRTITVPVAGDSAIELNDSFTVTLSGLQAGVSLGTAAATGVIINDDVAPVMAASSVAFAAFAAGAVEVAQQQVAAMVPGLIVVDTVTGKEVAAAPSPNVGPVNGIESEFTHLTPENLAITVPGPNWFLRTGAGDDAITAHGGRNVVDSGGGSNFLTGGAGADTFFVDARDVAAPVRSTLADFAAGDTATLWGNSADRFDLAWHNNFGAPGHAGLTLVATSPSQPATTLTLAGYSRADLDAGRLQIAFCQTDPATPYLQISAVG